MRDITSCLKSHFVRSITPMPPLVLHVESTTLSNSEKTATHSDRLTMICSTMIRAALGRGTELVLSKKFLSRLRQALIPDISEITLWTSIGAFLIEHQNFLRRGTNLAAIIVIPIIEDATETASMIQAAGCILCFNILGTTVSNREQRQI